MTRRPARGPIVRDGDEQGVSNVLGAVLMFGLLVLVLVTIQVRFVPVWDEDREAHHMAQLQDQLAQVKSDLVRQAGNDTAAAQTNALTLKRTSGFDFFSGTDVGGTATFAPASAGTGVSLSTANPVTVMRRNGEALFSLDPDWPAFVDDELTNVASIQHMRLRVDLVEDTTLDSYLDPDGFVYSPGDKVTLYVYQATDDVNPYGTVVTTFEDVGSEAELTIQFFDGDEVTGEELSSDTEALFQGTNVDHIYFDLLDGAYFFEPLLAAGQAPFRLELIEAGLVADYQIAYTDPDSGGIAGGSGLQQASFSAVTGSGVLTVQARNERFVDQTFVLEHGAVILVQHDGANIVVPPAMGVDASASIGSFTWTVPALTGDAMAKSGSRTINAVVTPTGTVDEAWFTASRLAIDIPTSYGVAWCDYLDGLLGGLGWAAGTEYTLTPTTTACQATLFGPVATPSDTTQDLFVRYRASLIDLTLSPA